MEQEKKQRYEEKQRYIQIESRRSYTQRELLNYVVKIRANELNDRGSRYD